MFEESQIDRVATKTLPEEETGKLVPIKTLDDGNCLYNATSKYLTRSLDLVLKLRLKTVNEIMRNRLSYDVKLYANYVSVEYGGFKEDVVESITRGTYSSLRQILSYESMFD